MQPAAHCRRTCLHSQGGPAQHCRKHPLTLHLHSLLFYYGIIHLGELLNNVYFKHFLHLESIRGEFQTWNPSSWEAAASPDPVPPASSSTILQAVAPCPKLLSLSPQSALMLSSTKDKTADDRPWGQTFGFMLLIFMGLSCSSLRWGYLWHLPWHYLCSEERGCHMQDTNTDRC